MTEQIVMFEGLDSAGDEALWETDGAVSGTIELGGLGNAGVYGEVTDFSPLNSGRVWLPG